MKNRAFFLVLLIGLGFTWNNALAHSSRAFSQVRVSIGNNVVTLDYAGTSELREHGLQHKKVLCDDCGMLSDYGQNQVVERSTKAVFLPIDIAFIQDDGEIVRITQMLPFEEQKQSSKKPVRYVIEMNQGWFTQQGIKVGDRVVVNPPEHEGSHHD